MNLEIIKNTDTALYEALQRELTRQRDNIELIASENYVSEAVLAAAGSHLTNKYAEGYPSNRYYGGCEYVDEAETLAIDRAKKLFGAEHANVQPHSGANANHAAFYALLEPNDTVLGMSLDCGGHLTHGSKVNYSGRYYNIIPYGVDRVTHRINYDEVEELALKHKPKLILAGASAYPRAIDFERFSLIAKKIGAYFMVDMAHIAGLIAASLHQNPVEFADIVTTTTHKTLRGPRGGMILCKEKHAKAVDKAVFPGLQGGPLMHIIAAKAVCFHEAGQKSFAEYQKQILLNSKTLERVFSERDINMISGGSDNHLLLIDLTKNNKTGVEITRLLDSAKITVNKNAIPFEPLSPRVTSGIRVGTAAMTTRGFKQAEFEQVGHMIADVIHNGEEAVSSVKSRAESLTSKFRLY